MKYKDTMNIVYTPDLDNSSENLNLRQKLMDIQPIQGYNECSEMETFSEDQTCEQLLEDDQGSGDIKMDQSIQDNTLDQKQSSKSNSREVEEVDSDIRNEMELV